MSALYVFIAMQTTHEYIYKYTFTFGQTTHSNSTEPVIHQSVNDYSFTAVKHIVIRAGKGRPKGPYLPITNTRKQNFSWKKLEKKVFF